MRYASILDDTERLTGESIRGIHIVGGGSLNDLLNQATADASGRPVLAGPVEAAALGNLCVQAIGDHAVTDHATLTDTPHRNSHLLVVAPGLAMKSFSAVAEVVQRGAAGIVV